MSKKVKVIGVVFNPNNDRYYIDLENGDLIRVEKKEYQKMKRRLTGKAKVYFKVDYG